MYREAIFYPVFMQYENIFAHKYPIKLTNE